MKPFPFKVCPIVYFYLIFNTFFFLSPGNSQAQRRMSLRESSWEGTHSPLKKGSQIFFQSDTLVIVDLEAIKPADQYRYVEKNDTLFLFMLDEVSISCREEKPGRYRVHWANNGEKMYLKPIEDQCLDRFTLLVSESPWYRLHENGSQRKDWHFLDPDKDKVPGISLYEAYKWLKNKKATPIKVAVIDSPVDYTHEDLREVMWNNDKEIPDNQVDDDQNGFRDDVRGWCFCCSRSGQTIAHEQPEATQIVSMWKARFDTLSPEKAQLPAHKKDFQLYQKALRQYEEGYQKARLCSLALADSLFFIQILGKMRSIAKDPVDQNQIMEWNLGPDEAILGIKTLVAEYFVDEGTGSFHEFAGQARKLYTFFKKEKSKDWLYHYNLQWLPRTQTEDHPEKPYEKMYGSGFLKTPAGKPSRHGTMVAGIIGARRNNGKGMEGIADQVQIITLGAVPDEGDERDKDVANAIRYAVDQGAKIINMSFAKRFSPHKTTIDEALRYAEKKNVLMIRAAGNSGMLLDTARFYPLPRYENGEVAGNWIVVGNSTALLQGQLANPSSNYGKKSVDLFAPGTDIFSASPGQAYETASGTSLSAPVVAGVAALIWSYFPQLSVQELKKVLLESVYKPNLLVAQPGDKKQVPFSSLSASGGIINARAAVFLAEKYSKPKKK